MANKKQLRVLRRQGVKIWNQWREEHLNETIDLSGADLSEATLREVDFRKANLSGANLSELDLSEADLFEAILSEADLSGADLSRANLSRADISRADISGATLSKAKLSHANLGRANLSQATITGVCLYNTARDNWMIDGVKCDYVFWDDKPSFSGEDKEQEKQWELEHRTPKGRDFRPGEFEELYKQLPTFDYVFKHGFTALDAVVMSRIVEAINEQQPEIELRLDSFHSRGQPHAKFTVLHKENIEEALKQVTTKYETQLKVLEGQRDQANQQLQQFMTMLIERPQLQAINITITQKGEVKNINQLDTTEALQEQYALLTDKLNTLEKANIVESNPELKFELKHKIEETTHLRKQVEQRLEELERKEKNTNKE